MCGFSVTAYAGGGDESDDTPTPVTEETPAPETEPEEIKEMDGIFPVLGAVNDDVKIVATFGNDGDKLLVAGLPSISLTKWTKRI